MANFFNIPTLTELVDRMRADVRQENPNLDPTIRRSWARAFTDALAVRIFGVYLSLLQLIDQMFPQTATGAYLARWGEYSGLSKNVATVATGTAVLEAVPATSVPAGTLFSSGGQTYESVGAHVAGTSVNIITSLTRVGTTATAVTSAPHGLASGLLATMSGTNQGAYNITAVIVVLNATTFTYQVAGSPATPATTASDILVTIDVVRVPLVSQQATASANLPSGAVVELSSAPIAGLTTPGFIDTDQVAGGLDAETDEEFRPRIMAERAEPTANYNEADVRATVLGVSTDITRVFVNKFTPNPGQAEVYFLLDNSSPITPNAGQISDVTNTILGTIYPAHSDPADLFVLAPVLVTQNFAFSTLVPNTQAMRDAVQASLTAFFEDEVEFQTTVIEDKYRGAISTTVDSTGAALSDFTLTAPLGDLTVSAAPSGQIAALGTVSF